MQHILVVDDDEAVRVTLGAYLKAEGFAYSLAENARTARDILKRVSVDLVLLDIRLPDEDGLGLTRWLRTQGTLPIILISGLGEDVDRIIGLEVGADDYVVKPFNRRELLARIRAVLRRANGPEEMKPAEKTQRLFEGWCLDLARRRLTSPQGEDVTLTRGEFDMLEALTRSAGRALSRDQILDLLPRQTEPPIDRTVDVMVRRLRKKMEPDPSVPRQIVTVYGVGYIFAPEVTTR
jgi:DNA-binding response OmpR family regulator